MTHDPIKNATDRLDEIRMEIATLQAEAREIEGALTVMRRFTAVPGRVIVESQQRTVEENIEKAIKNSAPGFQLGQAEFEVLAKRAIEEAGRPITRTQILRWLQANGTPVPGTDPSKTAGTKLWRARDKFVNIRGAGYWFRDQPCPAVGYVPTGDGESIFEREEDAAISDPDDEDEAA
ncbi:MAG TPA: hypothetical protein VKQ73_11165 [Stellaceae bacterium]|nr:hypothetical protein [Stellaceae bacterium]